MGWRPRPVNEKPQLEMVDPTPEFCDWLSDRLRYEDRRELRDLLNLSPRRALHYGLESSDQTWGALADGRPCLVAGSKALGQSVTNVWLVGSYEIETIGLSLCKFARKKMYSLAEDFPYMVAVVDERNTAHVRWIEWLGFSRVRASTHGKPFAEYWGNFIQEQEYNK